MRLPLALALAAAALLAGCERRAEDGAPGPPESAQCRAAAEYSRQHHGVSLLVLRDGETVCEDYARFMGPGRASAITSGTKGFPALLLAAAAQDGLLSLDERVSATIDEWTSDPDKRGLTVRDLLSLSGGVYVEDSAPTTRASIDAPLAVRPRTRMVYNSAPFQVFGEVLRRKLKARTGESLEAYFERRIAVPLDIDVHWSRTPDGAINLATGASITARHWARVGELVRLRGAWKGRQILDGGTLDAALRSRGVSPVYGAGWWRMGAPTRDLPTADIWSGQQVAPPDMILAVGAGKQRLYVSAAERLVIVRQAEGEAWRPDAATRGFSDVRFLTLLLRPGTEQDTESPDS